ncbi:MAG: tetratricopeptide repeat protein [Anaerolineae bacterium]|nr:tetratricopeptide repeat protein [Anaerolineae bacterium]
MGTSGDTFNMSGDFRESQIYIKSTIYQHLPPQPVDEAALAAACARLAALPLDDLPDPAPLPPGSRILFNRNKLFVGREDDLKALAKALKGGATAAIGQIAAATGLGGIGKTQLASEFVHRYGQFFAGGVFWLSFGDPQGVRAEIANCGGPGALDLRPDFANLPLDDQVRLVLSAWCSPLPRLLVFDNCEDENLLTEWRPPSGGARVLLTSRRGEWSATLGVQTLPLDVLSRPESIALLRRHRPDLSDEGANAIAAELGDLPLALHLAGSFLAAYRYVVTPGDYLTQLRTPSPLDHPSLQGHGAAWSPTSHELHVARTFVLSYERLNPQDPTDAEALALLRRAAHFAPGVSIPRPLLLSTLGHPADDLDTALRAEDALARLTSLGLLTAGAAGRLTLHRLLSAFVRGIDADDVAQAAVEETLLDEANRLNNAGVPAPLLRWQEHLRAVTDVARVREDERAAGLCNTLGYHLNIIGDYSGARPYLERALTIWEQVLGPDHPDTAQGLNNMGFLLQAMGDLVRARPYYARALAIREQVLGPDHPDTAQSLNNLGFLLRAMGDLAGARPYYERALAISEQVLGPDHPDTASSLNNMGALLDSMGDLAGARPYYERALAIREQVLGPDHPDTARSLNNMGFLLQAMGDLAGARPYYARALAIREQVLGPDHPDTARSLNNMGGLLLAMGDLAGARPYYERALAIRERVLGPDHPDTAQGLNNLAILCCYEGNFAEAARLMRRALAICEARLGPAHPNTQSSRQSLAAIEGRLRETKRHKV